MNVLSPQGTGARRGGTRGDVIFQSRAHSRAHRRSSCAALRQALHVRIAATSEHASRPSASLPKKTKKLENKNATVSTFRILVARFPPPARYLASRPSSSLETWKRASHASFRAVPQINLHVKIPVARYKRTRFYCKNSTNPSGKSHCSDRVRTRDQYETS